MQNSFATRLLLSLLLLVSGAWSTWNVFHSEVLPFSLKVVDPSTAVVLANPGFPMPTGITPGGAVDLAALDEATREAIVISDMQGNLPADANYRFAVHHDGSTVEVPVLTQPNTLSPRAVASNWMYLGNILIFSFLGLLVLWRGQAGPSSYLAAWVLITLVGFACNYGFSWDGPAGILVQMLGLLCFVCTRTVFYLMIETVLGSALSPRARLVARTGFVMILVLGTSTLAGGHLLFALTGWAGLMLPVVGTLFSAAYLVPMFLLVYGYGRAAEAQKPQLRWLLLSLGSFLISVFLSNSPVLDVVTSQAIQSLAISVGIIGMTYATLRHRVVDVRVILDHTLVYGATTALVVGVVAALNSLALRATLGEHTGLLLQIVIPLALGIVLGKVRAYLDMTVERVFFRRKYLAEKALQAFGRQAGHMESPSKLLEAAVREIRRNLGAPSVALYSAEAGHYRCLRQAGAERFPKDLDLDDAALVALRTERESVALPEVGSALGSDGCVFPMMVLGNLRGAVVCRNRPGEHYALDERRLLTRVAGDVGAALRIMRARDNEAIVTELVAGKLPTRTLRAKARSLAYAG